MLSWAMGQITGIAHRTHHGGQTTEFATGMNDLHTPLASKTTLQRVGVALDFKLKHVHSRAHCIFSDRGLPHPATTMEPRQFGECVPSSENQRISLTGRQVIDAYLIGQPLSRRQANTPSGRPASSCAAFARALNQRGGKRPKETAAFTSNPHRVASPRKSTV